MVATSLTIDLNLNPFSTTHDDTHVKEVGSYDDDYYHSFEKEVDDHSVWDLSRKSNENKKLKEMLIDIWDKYNSLTTHVNKLIQDKEELESSPKKRKFDETVQQSLWKRPREELPISGIKRVYVKVDPSDKTLVVKDGYQWRKYGQKVQRSMDDDSLLVATYEGEHNHRSPMEEATYALANGREISTSERWFDSPKLDEVLVEQMASYLCKDQNFTSQLAAAITSKISDIDLFKVC
ncbi:hypothetical protein M8C21_016506 [Ambrosia artemisiifolia]|uniref:WRKY domain-containing protein n=1 Tax=Ambrosia artemisiifolia TaxID=4212 RepID=A0AAD5GW48_AMBAR|nr:hypothetical protein M8C21_016506 [Ambrosia artemisiifolia]